jgi:tetratricopeptide (TPR) repeat protein
MKRLMLTGVLAVASGLVLMAQQPAQGGAAPAGPAPKSEAELKAIQAMFQAQQAGPDAVIKAAEELLSKFADTQFKPTAYALEAMAYEQKGDTDKAIIFNEKVLEVDPKNIQAPLSIGQILAQKTRENDLDKEEKLGRAEKLLNGTLENLKTAAKPNPQLTDQQWTETKMFVTGEANNALGLVALVRKKYDVAQKSFEAAMAADPQPAYAVRLASALQQGGKNAEAIAVVDKVLADPQLHPQIRQVATNIKQIASQKK